MEIKELIYTPKMVVTGILTKVEYHFLVQIFLNTEIEIRIKLNMN